MNEWAFGGGLNDDDEHGGINIDQQENKKMAPISPSQNLDGEVSPEKRRGGAAPGPSNTAPSLRDATTPGAPSGVQTALANLGGKLWDPASVERELGWQVTTFEDNPDERCEFRDQVIFKPSTRL